MSPANVLNNLGVSPAKTDFFAGNTSRFRWWHFQKFPSFRQTPPHFCWRHLQIQFFLKKQKKIANTLCFDVATDAYNQFALATFPNSHNLHWRHSKFTLVTPQIFGWTPPIFAGDIPIFQKIPRCFQFFSVTGGFFLGGFASFCVLCGPVRVAS